MPTFGLALLHLRFAFVCGPLAPIGSGGIHLIFLRFASVRKSPALCFRFWATRTDGSAVSSLTLPALCFHYFQT